MAVRLEDGRIDVVLHWLRERLQRNIDGQVQPCGGIRHVPKAYSRRVSRHKVARKRY